MEVTAAVNVTHPYMLIPARARATFFNPLIHRRKQSVLFKKHNSGLVILPIKSGEKSEGAEIEIAPKKQTLPVDINQIDQDMLVMVSRPLSRAEVRRARKRSERTTYLIAAIMSSLGTSSLAIVSVYYRFAWQMEGGEIPVMEMFGTFALSVGAAVGMEFWARWAHRALWHASLWHMHESHHLPRDGPFELNDVFAIINAIPAIALLAYGFFSKGFLPGLCFGAGLGITVFGMAYMFVHDGLVHRRFPVGPVADVPYLRRVAAAHSLHHSEKFKGVPYGLFLGPAELEEVGGTKELDKEVKRRFSTVNHNGAVKK